MNESEIKMEIEQIGYQEFYRYYQEKDIYIDLLKQENERLKSQLDFIDEQNKCIDKLENGITNLQKENQSLKNNYNDNEQAIHKIMEENEQLRTELNNYKSRNEKALFFIDMDKNISTNWNNLSNEEKDKFVLSLLNELENILQGSDE